MQAGFFGIGQKILEKRDIDKKKNKQAEKGGVTRSTATAF